MAELNWGLLDRNTPMQVAGSFADGQKEMRTNALLEAQMQGETRKNKLADLAMSDEMATRDAYKSSGGDMTKVVGSLQQGGQYKQAMDLQGKLSAQQKQAAEAQKMKLEGVLKQYEAMGQIMSGVKDQASYDMARQEAAQILGPAAANIPPVYDPAAIEQGRMKAMSVKDQIAKTANR